MQLIDLGNDCVFLKLNGAELDDWLYCGGGDAIKTWPKTLSRDADNGFALLNKDGSFESRSPQLGVSDQVIRHFNEGYAVGFNVHKDDWPKWCRFKNTG